jgi:vancomycin permeability regulator SanA
MKTKKNALKLLNLIFILIACGDAVLLVNLRVVNSVKDRILTPEEAAGTNADCILVLGAGVDASGRPSYMLADRLERAVELYRAGASDRLLVSGDHGRAEYDEVNAMKRYALSAGIPSENVFMAHAGFSPYESIYRARDVFQAKKIIAVTQDYHLYRSLYIAKRLGLEAYGVACRQDRYGGQLYRDVREAAARVKDFIKCIFKPKPTFLGEAMPVSGNGDATNDGVAG